MGKLRAIGFAFLIIARPTGARERRVVQSGAPLCNIRDLHQPVDLEVNVYQAAMAPVRVYGEHDFAAPGEPGAQA